MYTGISRFLQHWKASCEVICLGFFPDGNMLLGTGTCNLAIMFYRRNKNLKFWWLMRFVGSRSLKQPFWDFQGWRDSIQLLVGSQSPLDSTARACLSHRDTRPWPQITALQNGVLLCSLVVFIAWRWEALANSMQTASQEVFCSIWERKKKHAKIPKHSDDGNPK